ncbi:MAG: hypothetical protein WC786_06475 [Patescibacteria group bacterium]|jgi:hypothetical protein
MRFLKKLFWKVAGPYQGPRKIVTCDCGRVLWLDANQKIRRHHLGHEMHLTQDASFLWFLKLKLGLLDCRTLGEFGNDFASGMEATQ